MERVGETLIATVDNPPVNALSHAVRAGLVEAIDQLECDETAKALIIICTGRTFIAGADIREFNKPPVEPRLGAVIDRLDRCKKPVIAAIHGTALGGGLEVALACSYRVALSSAKFGLPEVKLGLLPGSGGIVRLPRLIGIDDALTMISEGNQISADQALSKGLVDELSEDNLQESALAFGKRIIAEGTGIRRTSDLPVPRFADDLLDTRRAALARKFKGREAPLLAVDLIEMMATTPFAEAAEKEYAACKRLIASPQSQALRHLFAAQRAAMKIDGVPKDMQPRDIRRVAVVGAGVMGRGIASCFLDIGLPVVLVGKDEGNLAGVSDAMRKVYSGSVKRGRMSQADVDRRLSDLTPTLDYTDLSEVDLVVEAVSEDLDTKIDVFRKLDAALPPHAIIATNTSFLDIEALASSVNRQQNVAGMHFFNPANIMKLLENVRASKTSPEVLATITSLGKRMGKIPVMVGRSKGFVANRMLAKRSREAQFLLEDGATPQRVDAVMSRFGFPIGPFALADLAGIDVMAAARAARLSSLTEREQACNIVDKLADAGRLGQKSGAGYYRYGEDRKPQADPLVDTLLAEHRTQLGLPQREIADNEILERCLYAMVNEAAKILDEGAAARPGDIDVIWTSGFGWPSHLGGPMFWADQIGVSKIKAALDRYSELVGEIYFKPAALIEQLAAENRGFLD